jgi:thiamine pyrophosphate-dependent acetolactate synthase large subunit-like protein
MDLIKYSESIDINGYSVATMDQLQEKLSKSLNEDSLAIIEVKVDASNNNQLVVV